MIETATSVCSVALLQDGAVVASAHENVGRGHAERLLPMIAALPEGGRAESVLVDCGPGSFTGIRVGVAAARGLGFGWGASVHGYSSLSLLAAGYGTEDPDHAVTVAINAGHGEVFIQSFEADPLRASGDMASMLPDGAAEISGAIVIGNAAGMIVAIKGCGVAIDRSLNACDALFLPLDLATLPAVPIYGRGADAKPMAVPA
ncbi:MAG: tsaB [Sphingomonadales bacterium]|nr:tsaB [Sphingomonadales bacterium]